MLIVDAVIRGNISFRFNIFSVKDSKYDTFILHE